MKIALAVLLGLLAAFFTHKHIGGRYYTHKSKYVLDGMTGRATKQDWNGNVWRVVVFEDDEVVAPRPPPSPQAPVVPEPPAKDFGTLWKESEARAMSKWPAIGGEAREDFIKFMNLQLGQNPRIREDPLWPEKVADAYAKWRGLPAK